MLHSDLLSLYNSTADTYNAPEEMHHSIFIGAAPSGGLLGWGCQVTPERPLKWLTDALYIFTQVGGVCQYHMTLLLKRIMMQCCVQSTTSTHKEREENHRQWECACVLQWNWEVCSASTRSYRCSPTTEAHTWAIFNKKNLISHQKRIITSLNKLKYSSTTGGTRSAVWEPLV